MSHYIPTVDKGVSRVRTGYERIIAQRSRLPFAYPAIDDGKIIDINEELKTITIQYKTKGLYVLAYGSEYSKNGGGGFWITQNIGLNNLTKGKSFKQGDILLYNTDYFINDPYSSQIDLSLGVSGNVVFMENATTVEDGSVMTKDLSERMGSKPVRMRSLAISKNTVIHKVAMPGVELKSIDPIMIFDESDIGAVDIKDKDTLAIISNLNKSTPKAKYSGIVVKVEAFYKCDIETMSDTVKTFIKAINKNNKAKAKYASEAVNKNMFKDPSAIGGDKIDGTILDDETIVLKFYIQQSLIMSAGDKLVFDGALKSVNSTIIDQEITTEDGSVKLDAIMSMTSVHNRMTLSPLFQGMLERVMEHIENEAVNMYFK